MRASRLYPCLLSVAITASLYLWIGPLSQPFIDDTAILLRYLDNVREGFFYTFNRGDGPVFGVSSPLHFILCSGFVLARFSSEQSVVLANAVGSFFFFLTLFQIFYLVYPHRFLATILTLVIAFGAQYLAISFFSGLETPLHLALIVGAVWLFLLRSRYFYLLGALSVISKLDALGVWLTLCLLAVVRDVFEAKLPWKTLLRQNGKNFFYWSLLPIATWIGAACWLFGTPLPQSFTAKMFHYGNPHDFSGRFLEPLFATLPLRLAAMTCGLFMLGAVWLDYRGRVIRLSGLASVLAFVCLAEYCFYNFKEQSYWYYALPEVMVLIAVLSLPGQVTRRAFTVPALFGLLALFVFAPRGFIANEYFKKVRLFLRYGEGERLALAKRVTQLTSPTAKLLAGHGYFFREFPGYVVDYSGLNSPVATTYQRRLSKLIEHFAPSTVVLHGVPDVELQRTHRMALRLSAYNIETFGPPAWRVFTLGDGDGSVARSLTVPFGNTVNNTGLSIPIPEGPVRRFEMGVVRGSGDQSVSMTAYAPNGSRKIHTCEIPAATAPSAGHETTACQFPFSPPESFNRIFLSSLNPVTIVGPLVVQPRE